MNGSGVFKSLCDRRRSIASDLFLNKYTPTTRDPYGEVTREGVGSRKRVLIEDTTRNAACRGGRAG
jgi:hypothetical protein